MVLLPALVLCAEVEGSRVLEVGRQHDGLVAGFARKLNTEVPSIECDKDEVEVLGGQVLGSECIESGDSVSKGTSVSNMLPSQSGQARYRICVSPSILSLTDPRGQQREILVVVGRVVGGARQRGANRDGDVRGSSVRKLTAERSDGSVDWLDEDTLVGDLAGSRLGQQSVGHGQHLWSDVYLDRWRSGQDVLLTSSSEFASSKIQPSSITSAESFVT